MENIREFEYRAPRFPADFHFLLQTELQPRVLYAHCFEISECGLVARLSEALEVDTRATLILTLPGIGPRCQLRRLSRGGAVLIMRSHFSWPVRVASICGNIF